MSGTDKIEEPVGFGKADAGNEFCGIYEQKELRQMIADLLDECVLRSPFFAGRWLAVAETQQPL